MRRIVPRVVERDEFVWFLRDRRYQGALKHSGSSSGRASRDRIDLTDSEVAATFRLLGRIKLLMDSEFSPDGYNVGWNCGRVGGQEVFHANLYHSEKCRQERWQARASNCI